MTTPKVTDHRRKRCQRCNKQRGVNSYTDFDADRVCKSCQKTRRTRNRRAQHLRETYDITLDEYLTMYHDNNGACWICQGKRKWLDVDHDHAKEKAGLPVRDTIRGLLCARCNRHLLRSAQDDPVRLRRAADYVEGMEAQSYLRI